MRKITLGLVVSVIITLVLTLKVTIVSAQGTFNCKYISAAQECSLDQMNCDSGYTVNLDSCHNLPHSPTDHAACDATHASPLTCIPISTTPPPPAPTNSYTCELDGERCIQYQAGNNCDSGFFPGDECALTDVGRCRSAAYTCSNTDSSGGENHPCKPGNICNTGLFCNLQDGFICQRCGALNEVCCPGPSLACGAANGLHCNNENKCTQGQCGVDTYNGSQTFCSLTAGPERIIVPGFSGCGAGQYCVTNRTTSTCGGDGQACCAPPKLQCHENGHQCLVGICTLSDSVLCGDSSSINTAIGCISITSSSDSIAFFLRWGLGIGGGTAFLLILYSGFMIMTSAGNPQRLKSGQELLTSAITGIIMLIFSIFLLRLIGVDILKIPGFGS